MVSCNFFHAIQSNKMKFLDMSLRKINKLHKHNFKCLPHLIHMILDHNEVTHILESLFEDLT